MWCHIEFKHNSYKYIRKTCLFLEPFSMRYFFLFEGKESFIAFEPKKMDEKLFKNIATLGYGIFRKNTSDLSNGEVFLHLLHVHCYFVIHHYKKLFEQQPKRPKNVTKFHHIVHCMLNAMSKGEGAIEHNFHKVMDKHYTQRWKHGLFRFGKKKKKL